MEHAAAVGLGEDLGQADPQGPDPLAGHRALAGHLLRQGLAGVVGQAEEGVSVGLVELVGHQGRGVADPSGRPDLPLEALHHRRVASEVGVQHLHGHPLAAQLVLGQVDRGHAAASQESQDLEAVGEGGARGESGHGRA